MTELPAKRRRPTGVRRSASWVLLGALALSACGDEGGTSEGDGADSGDAPVTDESSPPSVTPGGQTSLTVVVTADPASPASTWTIGCDPQSGDHPSAADACALLAELESSADDPFAPVPADQACTLIYGGPEVATIVGDLAGRSIDATFSRTNGCEIARWDALVPLLPEAGI